MQCIVIGPVCGFVTAGGRAGGVRTLLQSARAQCLRLSERFFLIDNCLHCLKQLAWDCMVDEGGSKLS